MSSHHTLLVACLAGVLASAPVRAQLAPSATEIARYSGLHAAAQQGDLAAVERLAVSRAAFEVRDAHGRTPLHVATFAKQRDVIRALAKAGADLGALENDRYDAVTIASVADDEETLRVLLAAGASARLVTSRYDGTALIAAAHLGHDGVVRQLIRAGARHVATLRALVEAGASTRLADREGRTPLTLAQGRGYKDMVEILLKAGVR